MHEQTLNTRTSAGWTFGRARQAGAMLGVVLLALLLGACASQNKPPSTGDYAGLYAQGRYTDAYDAAVKVAGTPKSGSAQAALIAGLSAQALGRNDDASRWLTPLVDNADPNVAGKSAAALGLIAKEQGQNSRAAMLLEKAASRLPDDDDAARALMYAGDAKRAMHLPAESRALYLKAKDKGIRDVGLKGAIEDRLNGSGTTTGSVSPGGRWSVQAGAFSSTAKAQAMANRLANKGATRIVPLNKNGQRLYYVRVGRYATKAEADAVRRAIGSPAFVVETTDER